MPRNSNDAIDKDLNKPAIVEFHSFDIKTSHIPHLSELMEELQRCYEYWKDGNQEIAGRLKDMMTLLKAERINVLRISDFNTTGLLGGESIQQREKPMVFIDARVWRIVQRRIRRRKQRRWQVRDFRQLSGQDRLLQHEGQRRGIRSPRHLLSLLIKSKRLADWRHRHQESGI